MDFIEQRLAHKFVMRHQVRECKFVPESKLFAAVANQSDRNPFVDRTDFANHLGQERRNYKACLWRKISKQFRGPLFQPRHLQFNIEKSTLLILLDDCGQSRQSLQLIRGCIGDRYPLELRIVTYELTAIRSKANVKLEAVTAVRKGKIKRGERIFGNSPGGAGSAMAEKKRAGSSHTEIVMQSV